MNIFIQLHPIFIELDVLEDLCSPGIIIPETGRKSELLIICYLVAPVGNVKETSPIPTAGTSYLLCALVSYPAKVRVI